MANYRNVEYVKTKMSCVEENWDSGKGEPTTSHPKYKELVKRIDEIKDEIVFELKLPEKGGLNQFL